MVGGGDSRTKSTAEIPGELKPLARSSAQAIQTAQPQLPLTQFTGFEPAGVPGLSSLQQFLVSSLIPGTVGTPGGIQGAQGTAESLFPVVNQLFGLSQPSDATQSALAMLGQRVGGPSGVSAPPPLIVSAPTPQSGAPAFPGITGSQVTNLGQQVAGEGGVPQVPMALQAPPTPTPGPAASPTPAQGPPTLGQLLGISTANIPPYLQALYNRPATPQQIAQAQFPKDFFGVPGGGYGGP